MIRFPLKYTDLAIVNCTGANHDVIPICDY